MRIYFNEAMMEVHPVPQIVYDILNEDDHEAINNLCKNWLSVNYGSTPNTWYRIDHKYWQQEKIVWLWENEHPSWCIVDEEWAEWQAGWDIPPLQEEIPSGMTIQSNMTWTTTAQNDMVKAMEPKPKKKRLPKLEFGLGPQEVIKVLKAQIKTLENNILWHETEQNRLMQSEAELQRKCGVYEHNIRALQSKVLDSEKLKDRILLLSKQLKIPVGNSNNTEVMVNDFIGQAWIRIKTQDGVDELAD
jgi:hypothetical protein